MVREEHDDVTVGVRAAEAIDLDALAADEEPHAVLERHVRLAGLIGLDHLVARLLR